MRESKSEKWRLFLSSTYERKREWASEKASDMAVLHVNKFEWLQVLHVDEYRLACDEQFMGAYNLEYRFEPDE